MSTDQKQPPATTPPATTPPATTPPATTTPTPPSAPNPLAEKLSSVWQDFRAGKVLSYRVMGFLLLGFAILGVGIYIWLEGRTADSAKWRDLDKAGTKESLEAFIKANPDNLPGRVARLHLARYKLGPEGIDSLAQPGPKDAAIKSIQSAQEDFKKLAEEFKDDPVFKAQCYHGLAKAEAALLGLEKFQAGGSVDKLIEYLDKLGEIDDKAPWCVRAKELSAALKDKNRNTRDELIIVQRELYDTPSLPGTGDFGAPGGPGMGPIPGLPSGHPRI